MLSSINPLGERARGQRWPVTVGAYLLGSLAGGAALGAAAGALGAAGVAAGLLPGPRLRLAIVAVALVTAVAWELVGARPPSWRRQVDQRWLRRYRGWVYGAGFGVQLGAGVVTIVTSATVYAVVLGELLTAAPAAGALLGACFGLVRSLPVLLTARAYRPDRLTALLRRTVAALGLVRGAAVLCCTSAAVAAGWLAAR